VEDLLSQLSSPTLNTLLQGLSSVVTAVATVVLGYLTWILARETRVLSRATAQAQVTATLEPNLWAANFVDIIVANSGNATAYDIKVAFDPPLPTRKERGIPLQTVSVLRPGQTIQSNLSGFEDVSKRTFVATVTWAPTPGGKKRESLSYTVSMMDYHDVVFLGARSPQVQIAEQVKKLREDWQHVARGGKRLSANVFDSDDREAEEARREELWRDMQAKKVPPSPE